MFILMHALFKQIVMENWKSHIFAGCNKDVIICSSCQSKHLNTSSTYKYSSEILHDRRELEAKLINRWILHLGKTHSPCMHRRAAHKCIFDSKSWYQGLRLIAQIPNSRATSPWKLWAESLQLSGLHSQGFLVGLIWSNECWKIWTL